MLKVKVRKFVKIAVKEPNDCSLLMWPFLCLLCLSADILAVVSGFFFVKFKLLFK